MQIKRLPEPIPQNFATIKVGKSLTALIDADDEQEIKKHNWFLKKCHGCTYAARKHKGESKECVVYMHRQIARAPRHFVVHHKNKKTLDNRKSNLQCCSKDEHRCYHKYGTTIPDHPLDFHREKDAKKCPSSKNWRKTTGDNADFT